MTKSMFLLLVLILFTMLAWLCLRFHAPNIQSSLEQRVQSKLFAYGYAEANVRASGRDLQLSGQVPGQSDIEKALELARQTRGVRRVTQQLEVSRFPIETHTVRDAVMDPPLQLHLTFEDRQLFLEGIFADEASHQKFAQWVATQIGPQRLQSKAIWHAQAPPNWIDAAQALALALFKMGAGEAALVPGKWQISGKIPHAAMRTEVDSLLSQNMPAGYAGSSHLQLTLSPELFQCQNLLDQALREQSIEFQSERADLEPTAHDFLKRIYQICQTCPGIQLRIAGHTDSVGNATANLELSQARAEVVKAFLVNQGIAAENISAIGLGSQFPLGDNASPQGRQRNRRIELIVLEGIP